MKVKSIYEQFNRNDVGLAMRRLRGITRYFNVLAAAAVFLLFAMVPGAHAQNLNWEGQTGAFVTPFAYTSASPSGGIGLPSVAFHYLDGGNVVGGLYEISGTIGFLN